MGIKGNPESSFRNHAFRNEWNRFTSLTVPSSCMTLHSTAQLPAFPSAASAPRRQPEPGRRSLMINHHCSFLPATFTSSASISEPPSVTWQTPLLLSKAKKENFYSHLSDFGVSCWRWHCSAIFLSDRRGTWPSSWQRTALSPVAPSPATTPETAVLHTVQAIIMAYS